MTRELSMNYTYNIVAFGDRRIKDIDVVLYKWSDSTDSWIQVAKDDDDSGVAMVEIKPKSNGTYKVEIKAYKFNEGYTAGHYGLFICHE